MSQENVELVRNAFETYDRRDIDAAFEFLDPEIEWVIAKEHPDARTLHGREALAAYRLEWAEILDDMHVEMDRILDAGDTLALVGTVRGVGVGSGAEVQVPIAFLYTPRDGKIVRVEEYLNPAEALAVVGLAD